MKRLKKNAEKLSNLKGKLEIIVVSKFCEVIFMVETIYKKKLSSGCGSNIFYYIFAFLVKKNFYSISPP